MRITFILSVLIAIFSMLLHSCNEGEVVENDETQENRQVNVLYGKSSTNVPKISAKVRAFTNTWNSFNSFEDDMDRIHKNTLEGLKVVTERLSISTDSLTANIPDTLKTQPITSRLLAVQTRVRVLKQVISLDRIDSIKVEDGIKELQKANTNFIVMMNEKFAKDIIESQQKDEEENELKKQEKLRAEILRQEILDNQQ